MNRTPEARRSLYITLVAILVVAAAILLYSRHGIAALAGLKADVDGMTASIESLEAQIDSLEAEIGRLRTDSLYLERIVREILGWGRPGEYIVRFSGPATEKAPF